MAKTRGRPGRRPEHISFAVYGELYEEAKFRIMASRPIAGVLWLLVPKALDDVCSGLSGTGGLTVLGIAARNHIVGFGRVQCVTHGGCAPRAQDAEEGNVCNCLIAPRSLANLEF